LYKTNLACTKKAFYIQFSGNSINRFENINARLVYFSFFVFWSRYHRSIRAVFY